MKKTIAETISLALQGLPGTPSLSLDEASQCANQLVNEAITIPTFESGQLTYITKKNNASPEVIHYKPRAAGLILLSLVTGIAGSNTGFLVASAVLSCALALADAKQQATPAEGLLFWLVYRSRNHSMDREKAKSLFFEEATKLQQLQELSGEGFEIALHSLSRSGYIKYEGTNIVLAETFVIHRRNASTG